MDMDPEGRERSSTDSDDRQFMHMSQAVTRDEFLHRLDNIDQQTELCEVSPTTAQRLGPFSVFCLIMNRTIAAGIFANPDTVLESAGSPGLAVILWIVAGLTVYAIMVCWLELGMSVPFYDIRTGNTITRQSAPRSGGDKNYLEYIYKKPRFLATCIFGVTFLAFSNTAGNAIQFGIYVENARHGPGIDPLAGGHKARVLGWAVGLMSTCCLINISTRRYAIGLNNIFAVLKIIFVLFIIIAGFAFSSRTADGTSCRQNVNLTVRGPARGFGDITFALVNALYPYGGFEQPFYVLAEVRQPKKTFPKATNYAMLALVLMYPLVNASYFCIVPYTADERLPDNIALAFFHHISRATFAERSQTMVSVFLAFFIFGNVLAQTFTASRVKQEVAKEGILPWSLRFSEGSDTLVSRMFPKPRGEHLDDHREQAPIAATGLHWGVAVLLIVVVGATIKDPSDAYRFLVYLKAFTILGVLGLLTVGGLLYLKIDSWVSPGGGRGWARKKQWAPWGDPLPAIVATGVLAVLLVGLCVRPTVDTKRGLPYWVHPLAGWTAPLLGVLWWFGLRFVEWRGSWKLEVKRTPLLDVQGDELVQVAEIIQRRRVYYPRRNTGRRRLFG